MGRGALWRDNQQSTFAHIHTSSSHSTTSPWSPLPYSHCVFSKPHEDVQQMMTRWAMKTAVDDGGRRSSSGQRDSTKPGSQI